MMSISKPGSILFFITSLLLFSLLYWCFFPGGYSPDSYFSYSVALKQEEAMDVVSPIFVYFWRLGNNYNFMPFLIDYLLVTGSLLILWYKLKSTFVSQIILLLFLSPFYFLSFIFVWKDNALLATFLLTLVLLTSPKNNSSLFELIASLFLLFIVFALRVNSMVLAIPLVWFITEKFCKKRLSKGFLTAIILVLMYLFNQFLIYSILDSRRSTYVQQFYVTDVAKINYKINHTLGIPSAYLTSYNSISNIQKVFTQYETYKSNDYFYYKIYENFNPLFHLNEDLTQLKNMRDLWFSTIFHHPIIYAQVRFEQWIQAVCYINYLFPVDGFSLKNLMAEATSAPTIDENKIFYEPKMPVVLLVKNFYHYLFAYLGKFFNYIFTATKPIIYIALNFFLLLYISFFDRKKYPNKELVQTIALAGFLYGICYLPILPSGDYRYFNCSILSCWFAFAVWLYFRWFNANSKENKP